MLSIVLPSKVMFSGGSSMTTAESAAPARQILNDGLNPSTTHGTQSDYL